MSCPPERRIHRLAVRLVVTAATVAAAAGSAALALASAPGPTALRLQSVRIAGARQTVEVIARFSGGNLPVGIVMTTDANPYDGRATVVVPAARISTAVATARGSGLRVRVTAGPGRLTFALAGAPRAITYVGYRRASSGRLVLVLWRSTPPRVGAHPRFGPAGCLTLRANVRGAIIRAAGNESRLFEHSFVLRLRARDGRLVAQRVVTAVGDWAVTLPFAARAGRVATLEAFAASAKDGSLACLAQQRVARA
jgi:hypothetical protein